MSFFVSVSVVEVGLLPCGFDLLDGAALLRADEGIRRDGGKVAVPCGRSMDDAGGGIVHPALYLGVVGVVEADEAVRVDLRRHSCALAHIGVGGLRHLERAVLADDFAVDVIAELAVDEDLIVDADAALRAQEHDLRILQMCRRCARDAREKHLRGDEVVVDEPVNDVDLVNRRVVHRHLGGVAVGYERVAMRAVHHERRTVCAGLQSLLDLQIALVIAAHKAELNEVFAALYLGIDDGEAVLGGRAEGLLTEDALARADGGEQCVLVRKAWSDDEDGVDIGAVDEVVRILELLAVRPCDGGCHVDQLVDHIGDGGDGRTLCALYETFDVVAAHAAAADDSNFQHR